MSFESFGLTKELLLGVSRSNYNKATPIQQEAIPCLMKGKDFLGIAPTGSGKTVAYALPVLQHQLRLKKTVNRSVTALVLVPTRELAMQVAEVFHKLSIGFNSVQTMAVFGGVSINPQMKKLIGTDVLIATPGRLLDLISKNAVELSSVKQLVLDEADQMLGLGFKEEVDGIFSLLPNRIQTALFSATNDNAVQQLITKILHQPITVELNREVVTPDLINQKAYRIPQESKGPFLRHLIKENNWQQVLVFVSSTRTADNIVQKLNKNGFQALALHGKKSQGARTDALTKFKANKLQVLVATDLAARGIDIKLLPQVINYELPRSPKDYIHRIGRTGRADSEGVAISFITAEDEHHFKVIQKKMKKTVAIELPINFDA